MLAWIASQCAYLELATVLQCAYYSASLVTRCADYGDEFFIVG